MVIYTCVALYQTYYLENMLNLYFNIYILHFKKLIKRLKFLDHCTYRVIIFMFLYSSKHVDMYEKVGTSTHTYIFTHTHLNEKEKSNMKIRIHI